LWNHGPIGIIDVVGFGHIIASSASAVSSARGLVGLGSLLTHWPFLNSLAAALIAAKTKISRWLKQAAALGVAMAQSSATEIANAASTYHLIASSFHVHSVVREKMWWGLHSRGKICAGGLPLLANPTTVTCYNMQNIYFLSGFRK
jgi:hypothetical protein